MALKDTIKRGFEGLRALRAKSQAAEEKLMSKSRISPVAGLLFPGVAFRLDRAIPLTGLHKAWQVGGPKAAMAFARGMVMKQFWASELTPHLREYVNIMIKTFRP